MSPSPQHIDSLFRCSPAPTIVFDRRLTVVSANEAYYRATGATPAILGGDASRLPDSPGGPTPADLRASLGRVLDTGRADRMPATRQIDPRGAGPGPRWRPLSYPVPDERGEVRFVVHTLEEIPGGVPPDRAGDAPPSGPQAGSGGAEADRHLLVARLDPDGRVADAGEAFLGLSGFGRAEVLGRPFWECGWWDAPDEARARARAAFERATRGEPSRGRLPYRRADGSPRVIELDCRPDRDAGGRLRSLLVTGLDVTERAQAERDHRSSVILESITDAFYSVGRDWRFTYINREAERLLGRRRDELIGSHIWEEFPEAASLEFAPAYRRAMSGGVSGSFELFYPPHARWYLVNAYPSAEGISVYFRDITARKRTEEELRRSEERYRTLFNSIDEGFCVLEVLFDDRQRPVDYRFLETNPAFERQTGLVGAAGKRIRELVPDIETLWIDLYGRVALTGEPTRFVDHAASMGRWFDVYAFRIGEPEGRQVALLFNDITRRRQDEEELRSRGARLAAALSIADLGTFEWDLRTDAVTLDGRSRAIFGLPDGQAIDARDVFDRIDPADLPRVLSEARRSQQDLARLEIEYRINPPGGPPRTIISISEAVPGPGGEAERMFGVFGDITARKRAEEALRASEEELRKFKFLSDNASIAFLLIDRRGRIAYANKAACRERGHPEGGLVGHSVTELNNFTRQQVDAIFERARAERVVQFETLHRRADGSAFPVEILTTYLELEDGPHLFSAARDITERRETQAGQERLLRQVQAERARLNHVFQRSPSFVAALQGPGHAFELVNRRFDRLVGRRDLIGRPAREALPEAEGQGFFELLDRVYRTGEPFLGKEFRLGLRPEPGLPPVERIIELVAEPIRDADGRVTGVLAHGLDLTEHKLAERALLDANRRKDEFLAMLAHELRNPLAAIANAIQVVQRSPDPGQLEWAKGVIARHVGGLARMVDDLLDVSRITRGKIELQRRRVEARAVASHAVETVRPLFEERGHALTVSGGPSPLWVEADPHRLEQVLVNLLANAAKYTEAGGTIRLDARREGGSVAVSVADNGSGIPPEAISEMFELFAQGNRSIARSEGGLGIGLTLVKSLVELHGGSVSARSDGPGKGSEFTVRLPAAGAPAPAPEGRPAAAPPAPGPPAAGARVLVVDDNEDAVRGLVALLSLHGHRVEAALDGPAALAAAHAFRPGFVVLDIGLPGMDGYEVAERLRADGFREATLIALSGYGEPSARRRSAEAGFDHHLVKPVDFEALDALIRGGAEADGGGRGAGAGGRAGAPRDARR